MITPARRTLAFIEGFRRPPTGQAHGTLQAAYLICQALAHESRHAAFHLYQERARNAAIYGEVVLPRSPPTKTFEKSRLHFAREGYAAMSDRPNAPHPRARARIREPEGRTSAFAEVWTISTSTFMSASQRVRLTV